jgi:hypothetical protein
MHFCLYAKFCFDQMIPFYLLLGTWYSSYFHSVNNLEDCYTVTFILVTCGTRTVYYVHKLNADKK